MIRQDFTSVLMLMAQFNNIFTIFLLKPSAATQLEPLPLVDKARFHICANAAGSIQLPFYNFSLSAPSAATRLEPLTFG
jgi:hypothetical protein